MPYLLQPLLRIRMMREDRASGELVAAKRELARAEEALQARQQDLKEWENTKDERRDRIYQAIIGQTVSRDQIDMANEGVARIDEEGVLKADSVNRAEQDRKRCESVAETARQNLNMAIKNRMKIDEHKAVWMKEEAAEQEARAEFWTQGPCSLYAYGIDCGLIEL